MESPSKKGLRRNPDRVFKFTDANLAALPVPKNFSEIVYDTQTPGLIANKNPYGKHEVMFGYRLYASNRKSLGITTASTYLRIPGDDLEYARQRVVELDEQARKGIPLKNASKTRKGRPPKPTHDPIESLLKDKTPQEQASYEVLMSVLMDAYAQAAHGKGAERHGNGQDFEDQDMINIISATSTDFAVGQAIKKLVEARRSTDGSFKRREWLGAIIYIAGAIVAGDREG